MTVKYILENNIKLNKIVMCVPGYSNRTEQWLKPNVQKIWDNTPNINIANLVKKIVVISSRDDEIVPFESWKDFAYKTLAEFIELEDWWHSLKWHINLIIEKIKY